MDQTETPTKRQAPPPPPPAAKKVTRPKITLQIPEQSARGPPTAAGPLYWGPPTFKGKNVPLTPATHISDAHGNPYFHPFMHMYPTKASDFMFKQFEGFKDFTMNTAKSGLSAGEKTAFWAYNKLSQWSKKWFTHLFLTLCLVAYSVMGAATFMALEGPHEEKFSMNLTKIRNEITKDIYQETVMNRTVLFSEELFLQTLEKHMKYYATNYTTCKSQYGCIDAGEPPKKKMWSFWNSMFYAGTIYTTIAVGESVVMSNEGDGLKRSLTLKIPIIKAESETQTSGNLVTRSRSNPSVPSSSSTMEDVQPNMSIRKRRILSRNRGHGARQREKTPEPGRTPVHEDTPSSEDEYVEKPRPTSRELEADHTYEEMRRLVQEQSNVKDPVYDLDTEEVMEKRAFAANERRRRSISPFAVPDKDESNEGSYVNPGNKLLSSNYIMTPKDEDPSRRSSLTTDDLLKRRNSLTPPGTNSEIDKKIPYPIPTTPKKLEKMVYEDEVKDDIAEEKPRKLKTPVLKENVFTFDEKDTTSTEKVTTPTTTPDPKKYDATSVETIKSGEIVTKVIQVERTPSSKLSQEDKPKVEVRERIVRTPSRKMSTNTRPTMNKQQPNTHTKEEIQSRAPPVKPARSKSATRFGSKTSESEMSEDQRNIAPDHKRRVVPTPRRFIKNRSPRPNRSQSVARVEDIKIVDRSGVPMTQTSREIIELMQRTRGRSLSIPKDDPRLPVEYNRYSKILQTPNKTPVSRSGRGISCPKTIQIISDKEILSGLSKSSKSRKIDSTQTPNPSKSSRQKSGHLHPNQPELTSSCSSTSPSENEYDFDLSERAAELTRKLNKLTQDVSKHIKKEVTSRPKSDEEPKSTIRKRIITAKNGVNKKERKNPIEETKTQQSKDIIMVNPTRSKWKFIANWQQFKQEQKINYMRLKLLRNRCFCDLLLLIIFCGCGGMMFRALEGSFENAYKCSTRNVKRDFIESLWRGSHYLREDDWKSMARKKMYEFEEQLHTAHEAGVTSYSGQRSWNFMNSFVYCLTLITTIGYGHIAPKTTYGRVATIAYAIIGIPLFLIVLADFGKLFTRIIKFFWAYIRRFYYTRSCRKVRRTVPVQEVMKGLNIVYDVVRRPSQVFNEEDFQEGNNGNNGPPQVQRKPSDAPPPLPPKPGQTIIASDPDEETEPGTPAPSVFEIDDEFNLPISVAIVILIVYILIGALVYNFWETWNFFESFYFVFISMSTIGLGDLVPDHPMFMMASILYLVFGLALTSMCINVVQEKLSDTFKQASAKLGATIGLKVAEEDGSLVPMTPEPTEVAPVHKPKQKSEEKGTEKKEA